MIWFVKHIGIGGSGVISSWCIVEAVSELREWISLLEYVTWQHNANLNGSWYDYWVSKGWSTTWFNKIIGIGGYGVISLLCMAETVGESRWHLSLLEYVTWWHKTNLNGHHYDYWVSKGCSMIWFLEHIVICGSGVISSRCIVEAISELREWISLLTYVTWQHKTNLNGSWYDYWVSKGWSTTWFIEIIGIGGSGVISLLCMAETVGKSRWHMSLLQYVTWCHKTNLNGPHYDFWVSKGWSMIWFVKHIGIGDSGVISLRGILEAVGELREWISLLEYVTWQHKTNLNGCCNDYWGSKGWSTTWIIEIIGIGGSGVISLLCMAETVRKSRWHMSLATPVCDLMTQNQLEWTLLWLLRQQRVVNDLVLGAYWNWRLRSDFLAVHLGGRRWIAWMNIPTQVYDLTTQDQLEWMLLWPISQQLVVNYLSHGADWNWGLQSDFLAGHCVPRLSGCKSHEWMSLLQYVTWCHKTNLNGPHYDYWVS